MASSTGIVLATLLLLAAYKNLPFVWFFRFLRTLITRLKLNPTNHLLTPECLFLPAIHRTRSPLTECDYNIHKSNSTYFTDLDVSRGNLSLLLFGQYLSFQPTARKSVMILSGVQIVFRKEILPYQGYEVWSRVMSWDEKWLYIVSHFVERNAFGHGKYLLQGKKNTLRQEKKGKATVYASAVSRYVFKQQQKKTLSPEIMLAECGLLPLEKGEEWAKIEERREKDLVAARLESGWDAVHDSFDGDENAALGRYVDLLWR